MSSKLLSSPQTSNILQPRRLNANAVPAGGPIGGSASAGTENHYGLTTVYSVKEVPASVSPTKASAGTQINHDLGLFSMSGSRVTGPEAKRVFGNTGSGKKGVVTMAKRNARERNRVKQVNQGFQTLRQHIPERYRMKKMSKVDTLRCALEYIRSLEEVLDEFPAEFQDQDQNNSEDFSSSSLTQHLDRICCTPSAHLSATGDLIGDQSQSFTYSEPDEDEETGSFLQLTNSEILQTEHQTGQDFKLKLEHSEQYITVVNMAPMILANSMSMNMIPSNSPAQVQISGQTLELKLFSTEALNEN